VARVAFKASLEGEKELKAKLRAIAGDKGMRKHARGAALEVAALMLEQMKARTPVKTGKLRASERIKVMVSSKKEDIRISLLAGGPDVPYARIIHEDRKLRHPNGGQAKYMESVILEAVPTAAKQLADKIDLRQVASA